MFSGQHGQNQDPDISTKLDMLQKSDNDRCTVCLKDVSTNSGWVHTGCIGISDTLKPDSTFRCKRCIGLTRPVDGRPVTGVTVVRMKLDVVRSFCYLGESLSSGGGCELASIRRCWVACGKFNELLPIPTSRSFPIIYRERNHNTCIRGAMLRARKNLVPRPRLICIPCWMCSHHQGSSQLTRTQGEDAARWSCIGTPYP